MSDKTVKRSPETPVATRVCMVLRRVGEAMVVPLAQSVPLVVGRGAPADVVVADETLSRRHARFVWSDDGIWVEDLGSLNGTRVGDKRLKGRALLTPGQQVTLGQVTISIHEQDNGAPQTPIVEEESFDAWLQDALAEARSHNTTVALLMVRTERSSLEVFHKKIDQMRALLEGWDHMGIYGLGYLVAAHTGWDLTQAERTAYAIASQIKDAKVSVAVFPDHGTSADHLIETLREMVRQTTKDVHVVSVPLGPTLRNLVSVDEAIVHSPKMASVFAAVAKVAASRAPVLLMGETGTGKEVVAQAIVKAGPRSTKPFIPVNCGALPPALIESLLFGHAKGAFTSADRANKGIFEEASGGTVFLDEVAELPLLAQATLLRVLETGRILRVGTAAEIATDVRVIAATNRDVDTMVAEGKLRADLVFRLNTLTIKLPPLRERPEDILPLATAFLARAAAAEHRTLFLSETVKERLQSYAWPGNVRELRNVIERLAVMSPRDEVSDEDLPTLIRSGKSLSETMQVGTAGDLRERLRAYEAQLILDALGACQWNQTEAARLLKLPVRTLAHKITQLDLKRHFPVGATK
ncbi:MAG: sigma 54-interacting transcriptional regulator [Deltaproteobacteria bacterium]|nr:sigma 54-interacting transcriptional regulator [Deltaproteobacteria bacterium]